MAAAVVNLTLLAAADAALSLSAPAVTFLGALIVSRVTLSVRPSAVTGDAWPRAPSPCLSLSAQPK